MIIMMMMMMMIIIIVIIIIIIINIVIIVVVMMMMMITFFPIYYIGKQTVNHPVYISCLSPFYLWDFCPTVSTFSVYL